MGRTRNDLAVGLLEEALDDPLHLTPGVAARRHLERLDAPLEQLPGALVAALAARWQHEELVELLEADRLEDALGVVGFPGQRRSDQN